MVHQKVAGLMSRTTGVTVTSDANIAIAAKSLARLMERKLGYQEGHIDPVALRLFIQAYWVRMSSLAHIIHSDPDNPDMDP